MSVRPTKLIRDCLDRKIVGNGHHSVSLYEPALSEMFPLKECPARVFRYGPALDGALNQQDKSIRICYKTQVPVR